MTEIQILYIIIAFMVLSIGYLFYRINKKRSENFETVSDIKSEVNKQYRADIDAMRNLAQISDKIMTNKDNLILPANITIPGKLIVDGDVVFTNKDKNTNIFDILPRFTVISYASSSIPKGWVLCDGRLYYPETYAALSFTEIPSGTKISDPIITPDLRGRFVLGAGQGSGLTNRTLDKPLGGEENHTLTEGEIPNHSHDLVNFLDYGVGCTGDNCQNGAGAYRSVDGKSKNRMAWYSYGRPGEMPTWTGRTGGNTYHNNMPPYYVLTYIMKL